MIITPKHQYSKYSHGSEQRVEVQCDSCGKINTTTYANYYRSQKSKGFSGKTYCRGCASKKSAKSRRGKPAWNKGVKLPESQKGENHPSWKGGTFISSDGYKMIHCPGYANTASSSKWAHYKKEHIVIVETALNRKLNPDEVVHHIDGDKLNNDLSNLFVTTKKAHHTLHYSLFDACRELIHAGLIVIDATKQKYVAHDKLRELLEHLKERQSAAKPNEGLCSS